MEYKSDFWKKLIACGAQAVETVNRMGYELLAANGYPEAAGGELNSTAVDAIRKKMSKRGEKLIFTDAFDEKAGQWVIRCALCRGKRTVLATSPALLLQGKAIEGYVDNAEG